jgi:hypothetical protein
MASTWIVEPIDILEGGSSRLTTGWPVLPPEPFRLQAFEKRFDSGVVKTVSLFRQ